MRRSWSAASESVCPGCLCWSRRIHSSYLRSPADVPSGGRRVVLWLQVGRFLCPVVSCGRRTFAEQMPGLTRRYGRPSGSSSTHEPTQDQKRDDQLPEPAGQEISRLSLSRPSSHCTGSLNPVPEQALKNVCRSAVGTPGSVRKTVAEFRERPVLASRPRLCHARREVGCRSSSPTRPHSRVGRGVRRRVVDQIPAARRSRIAGRARFVLCYGGPPHQARAFDCHRSRSKGQQPLTVSGAADVAPSPHWVTLTCAAGTRFPRAPMFSCA